MEQNFFRETAEQYCARFQQLAMIGIVEEMSFEIDSKDFDDKYKQKEDIRYAQSFQEMFSKLALVDTSPCLYRWEITPPYNANEIKEVVCRIPKYTPRVLRSAVSGDNTLYVGKVQSHIVGRIIQHLGYHTKLASHGLHLCEWAKEMRLKFKLHVIVLPKEVIGVEEIFEKELALKYEPLIGIH